MDKTVITSPISNPPPKKITHPWPLSRGELILLYSILFFEIKTSSQGCRFPKIHPPTSALPAPSRLLTNPDLLFNDLPEWNTFDLAFNPGNKIEILKHHFFKRIF